MCEMLSSLYIQEVFSHRKAHNTVTVMSLKIHNLSDVSSKPWLAKLN